MAGSGTTENGIVMLPRLSKKYDHVWQPGSKLLVIVDLAFIHRGRSDLDLLPSIFVPSVWHWCSLESAITGISVHFMVTAGIIFLGPLISFCHWLILKGVSSPFRKWRFVSYFCITNGILGLITSLSLVYHWYSFWIPDQFCISDTAVDCCESCPLSLIK